MHRPFRNTFARGRPTDPVYFGPFIFAHRHSHTYTRKPCVGTAPTDNQKKSEKTFQFFFDCRVRSSKFRRFWGGSFEPSSILPLQLTIKKLLKNFSIFFDGRVRSSKFRRFWGGFFEPSPTLQKILFLNVFKICLY